MRSCSQFHLERGSLLPGSAPDCRRFLFWDFKRPWPAKIEKLARVEVYAPEIRRLGAKLLLSHSDHGLVRAIEWRASGTRGGKFPSMEEALAFFESDDVTPQAELFAVCAHGSRDTCCGKLGPGVAAALARAGAEVIEVSHPGGHRFAPTTLTFPEFRCYGHLTRDNAAEFLRRQRAGEFQPEHYRGPMYLGKFAQVAEAALWEFCARSGDQMPEIREVEVEEPDHVQLRTDQGVFVVRLVQQVFRGPASCGEEDDEMREFRAATIAHVNS